MYTLDERIISSLLGSHLDLMDSHFSLVDSVLFLTSSFAIRVSGAEVLNIKEDSLNQDLGGKIGSIRFSVELVDKQAS